MHIWFCRCSLIALGGARRGREGRHRATGRRIAGAHETLSRLQGEVLSLGLEVAIAERPARGRDGNECARLDGADGPRRDTDAVIEIIGDGAPAAVDVWVFERRPGDPRSRASHSNPTPKTAGAARHPRGGGLSSSLVEIDLAAKGAAQASGTAVAQWQVRHVSPRIQPRSNRSAGRHRPAHEPGRRRARAHAGRGGRLDRAVIDASWLALQGALAGFGSHPTVTSATGSARVAQQYALLGVRASSVARALQPYVALSAGVLRTTIDGQADTPETRISSNGGPSCWTRASARGCVDGRYHLTLAAHVQAAEPYIAIHFVDTLVATSGRPNLS